MGEYLLNFPCVRKYRLLIIGVVLVTLVVWGVIFLVRFLKPQNAGILIESTPPATVFIDGEQLGRTPFKETRKPGEIVVKLIPESLERPLAPYETKVSLAPGIETVVWREFGESDEISSGYIVSYERVGGKEAGLAVVSIPDAAQVQVDGTVRGFVPYKTSSITPGEHQIIVSSPGYLERTLTLKAVKGYKLTAVVKLAPSQELSEEEEPEEGEEERDEVEILSTPTGFLRVRSGPSTANEEITQVKPGERFPLIGQDEKTGWFEIEYLPAQAGEEGKTGWISNSYAKKVEESQVSPSPSPTTTPVLTETATPTPTSEPTSTVTPTP